MIKVVLWDVDGTLLNFEAAEEAAIRSCFGQLSLGVCSDEMLKRYSGINKKYWKMLELGQMSKPEILVERFKEFFMEYGIDPGFADEFNSLYQIALGDTVVFNDGAMETVRALSGRVLQCAVTNGTKIAQDRKLKNSALDKMFDHIFISDVLGIEKPNIGFFDKVFEKIGRFEGDEVMIVGDSLTSDIKGGVNAGIITCWYNKEKRENDLDLRVDFEIARLPEVLEIVKG